MKLLHADIRPRHDRTDLILSFSPQEALNIQAMVSRLGEIDSTKDYTVKVEKTRQKRSKDANAYMWELIGRLASVLNLPSDEVYRHVVRDYGRTDVSPVKTENMAFWTEAWESRGIGWQCEDLGECRNFAGYHNIRNYFGTSVYDTKQMYHLLEGLIQECKEQGIETMTPEQLEEMRRQENEYRNVNRKAHSRAGNQNNGVGNQYVQV